MSYKAICFDFDNTLVDTTGAVDLMLHQLVQTDAPEKSHEERAIIVQELKAYRDAHHIFSVDMNPYYQAQFKLGLERSDEEFKQFWTQASARHLKPFPKTEAIISDLKKKYALGIITNGYAFQQRAKLNHFPYLESFKSVLVGGEFGLQKPAPEIFQESMKQLGCKPEEMLFVGDNWNTDIQGALGVGVDCLWVHPDEGTTPGQVRRIDSIAEIYAYL